MTTAHYTDTLLDALRRNLSVLGELAVRYGIETQPERAADLPTISSPEDVKRLVQPEMANLAQEQLRVLLLNTRNEVVGQRVIYRGDIQSISVRAAEVFRPRDPGGGSLHHRLSQPPQRLSRAKSRRRFPHQPVGGGGRAPGHQAA